MEEILHSYAYLDTALRKFKSNVMEWVVRRLVVAGGIHRRCSCGYGRTGQATLARPVVE